MDIKTERTFECSISKEKLEMLINAKEEELTHENFIEMEINHEKTYIYDFQVNIDYDLSFTKITIEFYFNFFKEYELKIDSQVWLINIFEALEELDELEEYEYTFGYTYNIIGIMSGLLTVVCKRIYKNKENISHVYNIDDVLALYHLRNIKPSEKNNLEKAGIKTSNLKKVSIDIKIPLDSLTVKITDKELPEDTYDYTYPDDYICPLEIYPLTGHNEILWIKLLIISLSKKYTLDIIDIGD